MSFDHWLSNAARSTGRLAGSAYKNVGKFSGQLEKSVMKIPIIGPGLHGALLILESDLTAPLNIAVGIAQGKRVDRVLAGVAKKQLQGIHEIAPYVQSVISFVPGIGPGISGAIGAGLALAEGKRWDEVALAAAKGAVPGGPIAAMAFEMGKGAVEHKPISEIIAHAAGTGLDLPPAATTAISTALDGVQKMLKGERIDHAFVDAAVDNLKSLPGIPPAVQTAINSGLGVGMALGHAASMQKHKAKLITNNIDKLALEGQKFVDQDPTSTAAQALVQDGDGRKGFAVGVYVTAHESGESDLKAARDALSPAGKLGFDSALALHVGRVTTDPTTLPKAPSQQAGLLITNGLRGADQGQKEAVASDVLATNAGAQAGAELAIARITYAGLPWYAKVVHWFGLD